MALGADARGVVRLVLRRVSALMLIGLSIGAGLTMWATKFVGTLLFQLEARDPATIAVAIVTLAAVGLVAGWLTGAARCGGRSGRGAPTVAIRDKAHMNFLQGTLDLI